MNESFNRACQPGGRYCDYYSRTSRHLNLPASCQFIQQFVQADIKGTSKLSVTGPLLGESTGRLWIPLTKGQ